MPSGLLIPCFLFRVEFVGIEPPIWRSFLLTETANFHWLHRAILAAGGWKERHRFKFQAPEDTRIIAASNAIPDASSIALSSYFTSVGLMCLYQYDPEEQWQFNVRLVEMRGQSRNDRYLRRLVGGERAYPPEDCRGLRGYNRCLAVRTEWIGDRQPEAFDFHRARGTFDI